MVQHATESDRIDTLRAAFGCLVILSIVAIAIVVPAIKAAGGINYEYSEGTRSGTVQKFSKKGFIWKTWEGELNLGYARSQTSGDHGTSLVPAIWDFSAVDDDVAKRLLEAETSGDRVTISYKQYLLAGYNKGSTGYVVTGVSDE